ncbi:MAG: hypothetical protein QW478_11415 [Candidatus Micrarchaeaceae archaeon]
MSNVQSRHNLFIAMGKGVLLGFPFALLYIIVAALLSAMGVTYPFITSTANMGLFGFFNGFGIEVYSELIRQS